jgi:competence protein ComEC
LGALALGFAVGAALPACGAPPLPAIGALLAVALALSPPFAPLGLALAGWAAASANQAAQVPTPGREPEWVEGCVCSVPERLDGQARFALCDREGRRLLATAPILSWPLALGDRVRFQARLRTPEGQRNPGGRDRAAELAARGIALEAHAVSAPVRLAPPSPLAALESGRSRFGALADRLLPPREAALVRAIGAGDRSAVDPATSDAFARSGLAHLLSVSGLHLAVIAYGLYRALCALLVRWDAVALRLAPRKLAALAALPLTAGYALATGADVPVVRSALAVASAFLAVLLDREVDALNAVALAALVVLAAGPGALRDPSFQLSFASVAGLALWSGPMRRAIPVPADASSLRGRLREALLSGVCASAAATLATAPIVAFHFRRLSLLAVASNLAGVPIGSALTVVAAAAAVASSAAPALAAPLLLACRPLAWLLLAVNDAFAAPAWSALPLGSPGVLGALASEAALLAAWRLRGRARALAALLAAAALVAPAPVRRLLAERRGGLEAIFLGVGQGDAAAFLLADGSAVLVDGGGELLGRADPGSRDVVPFLRDAGVTRVAAMFLSHPHPDHMLGLVAVAAAFPIGRFFTNGRPGGPEVAAAWDRLPRAERFGPGDVFERAGVRFEALAPPEGSAAWSENDASLVLRVSHGQVAFSLCGDVEAEGEASLLASARPEQLAADVVKVPHHGSATSSGLALIAAVHPTYAVMAVGHENRFGFPAPDVVNRWREAGATVLRTDAGAVRFISNGRAVRSTPASASLDPLALLGEHL